MICEINANAFCVGDISEIENYEDAVADTQETWHCHHRAEVLPCGVYSKEDLKKYGLYFHRPASELIFLTHAQHAALHGRFIKDQTRRIRGNSLRGKKHTDEARRKMSEAHMGKTSPRKGKTLSETAKRKIGKANRGRKMSEQFKQNATLRMTGEGNTFYGKHHTPETKARLAATKLGRKCFNNGVVNRFAFEKPDGAEWKEGFIRKRNK